MSEAGLVITGLTRSYPTGAGRLEVLRGVDLSVRPGELVALVAPSGTGKSTLLHAAGLLEKPDGGSIRIGGVEAAGLSDSGRTKLRRSHIGFVYQFHHLLPEFSALENVVLPQMLAGVGRRAAGERATALLTAVGLAGRLSHRPARLSGGEQQRVAIVRALANRPSLLLADEPTGNLDPGTAASVFDTLRELVQTAGLAALIATHNLDLAQSMDRIVTLREGRIAAL
ncbi:MAG: ABC transporter ATP-binding protein [Alphaproteobacteria bacterium]|nr:MAG: ABC transporter ATP-binding protein [Alphaproteobacteria bacterium]